MRNVKCSERVANSIRTVRKDHKGHKDRKTYSFLLRLPLFETGSPLTSHLPLPRLAGRLANDQLSLKNGVPAFLGLAIKHFQEKFRRPPSFFFRILTNRG